MSDKPLFKTVNRKPPVRRNDLVEPELSYTIVGAILDVYHQLGHGLKESTYQRAVAEALRQRGLTYEEQAYFPIQYEGQKVGKIFLDFLISGKIVLEFKSGDHFSRAFINQVNEYLKVTGRQLAILANFTSSGVHFRRIVNINLA